MVTPSLNKAVFALLLELARFQKALFLRSPQKVILAFILMAVPIGSVFLHFLTCEQAKAKKRYLSGIREVLRSAIRGKLKAVIVATNLDANLAEGIRGSFNHQTHKQGHLYTHLPSSHFA